MTLSRLQRLGLVLSVIAFFWGYGYSMKEYENTSFIENSMELKNCRDAADGKTADILEKCIKVTDGDVIDARNTCYKKYDGELSAIQKKCSDLSDSLIKESIAKRPVREFVGNGLFAAVLLWFFGWLLVVLYRWIMKGKA